MGPARPSWTGRATIENVEYSVWNIKVACCIYTRKEGITKVEEILKIKIHKLDLDKSKDLLNDNKKDKNGRLDLRAVINDNIECDIEIQLSTHEKILERFLYYWSKIYTSNHKNRR